MMEAAITTWYGVRPRAAADEAFSPAAAASWSKRSTMSVSSWRSDSPGSTRYVPVPSRPSRLDVPAGSNGDGTAPLWASA